VHLCGIRAKAFFDLGIVAHHPFENGETNGKQEVNREDAHNSYEDDSLQQPHYRAK
jgi:hypothetical protein